MMIASDNFSKPPKITEYLTLVEYQTHCLNMSLHHFHRGDFLKGSIYHSFSKVSSVRELEKLLIATGDADLE